MQGKPIELSRDAMRRALALLDARDSFQILRFAENASAFAPRALPATRENLARERGVPFIVDAAQSGKSFFFAQTCANCHAIRGTTSGGTAGPAAAGCPRRAPGSRRL